MCLRERERAHVKHSHLPVGCPLNVGPCVVLLFERFKPGTTLPHNMSGRVCML